MPVTSALRVVAYPAQTGRRRLLEKGGDLYERGSRKLPLRGGENRNYRPAIRRDELRCSQCRKQHGAPFRSRVGCGLKTSSGCKASIWSSTMRARAACCAGSAANAAPRSSTVRDRTGNVPTSFAFFSQYGIPLAILDDPQVGPTCHIFVGSKAPWFEITDDLPQYQEYATAR